MNRKNTFGDKKVRKKIWKDYFFGKKFKKKIFFKFTKYIIFFLIFLKLMLL